MSCRRAAAVCLLKRCLALGLLVSVVWPGAARADSFDAYVLVETFLLPPGAGPFDSLPDGRLVTLAGDEVHIETAVGSRTFDLHGFLPGANLSSYGAAFIRVSPDGTRLAVGNGGGDETLPADYEVGVFDTDTLSGTWFDAGHYDAVWIDDVHLALTTGDFIDPSRVTALDTTSADPANPVNPTMVDNIGGASGGIVLDEGGNLYTGNGYSFLGPSSTGATKAFGPASWQAALTGGPVLDFETDGTLAVDILSASPLGFDNEGNLFVGGGDLFGSGEGDFLALVRSSAVGAALSGAGPVDTADPTQVRRLNPDTANDANFYTADYNALTGELYVAEYGDATVYVYADAATIPTMSTWAGAVMVLLLATAATTVFRRGSAVAPATLCPSRKRASRAGRRQGGRPCRAY
jgi:hypothetical protein